MKTISALKRNTISAPRAMEIVHARGWIVLPEMFDSGVERNAWNDFYRWALGEMPGLQAEGLHNGLIVGQDAMRHLLRLRKAQIRHKTLYRGEELERALNWSNIDQGPLEIVDRFRLQGRAVVVLERAFGEEAP